MKQKEAAVVFITGQSNAHAHAQLLSKEERITVPLKNVFSLDRAENQSFDVTELVWKGYTTSGKNLGESQDHTASMAYYLARRWQSAIDSGKPLPDLYIVQMSIGSQGIVNGMWNPEYPEKLIPGALGTVDISLYRLAEKIFPLVCDSLKKDGKEFQTIGWHWLGSEQDLVENVSSSEKLTEYYDTFFENMYSFVGVECPVYLYKLYSQRQCEACNVSAEALDIINLQFENQCNKHKNSSIVDLADCPNWDENVETLGVFSPDLIHYCSASQKWFADRFFDEVSTVIYKI